MPPDYSGRIQEGYDIIDLKPCMMMIFQGPPFKDEEFGNSIENLWKVMKTYNPEIYGFSWRMMTRQGFKWNHRVIEAILKGDL